MPLAVDEFETDDEWSFISPSAKSHERYDAIDSSAAYDHFSYVPDGRRKPAPAGGSQRQATKRPGYAAAAKSSYTYAHRLPPPPHSRSSGDSDGHGYGSGGEERASAAGSGGGSPWERQDWWEPSTQMRQARAPLSGGPSRYSSLGGADARASNGRADSFSTSDKAQRQRARARVQEALRVTDGGKIFLDGPDGYDDDHVSGRATDDDLDDALEAWLAEDESHGFIRVYSPPGNEAASAGVSEATLLSRLIPCTTAAEAHEICHVAGLQPSSLHVQLNGDVVRRLDAYERPLAMQNDYLTRIGYSDPTKVQKEGLSTELGYLIRFYSGRPAAAAP